MKNQYFGDINDYLKYGLLRSVLKANGLRMMVAWMLTPDDGSSNGEFTAYLQTPEKWHKHDPMLFYRLKALLQNSQVRSVRLLENTNLLRGTEYFCEHVPDSAAERDQWLEHLLARARKSDFIFLDPDNGLEVESRAYGQEGSSKFVFWSEVKKLWRARKSLLIYQRLDGEEPDDFVQRKLETLQQATPGSLVEAYVTPQVVFLMALQPEHQDCHEAIIKSVRRNWTDQICRCDLEQNRQTTH